MTDTAITVEDLSKVYRIGLAEEAPDTLWGLANALVRAPVRNFRRLRGLNTFRQKTYADDAEDLLWALRDINFEVKRGEVVGIIGRNGAGKSTLLKVLSRIVEPTTGRIRMRGRVSSLLEVGTGFHPELTGRENIYLNGTILGMTKAEVKRKFEEIVEFSGVGKFLDTPVKRYSSGMKVRLAFSVAAHLEPEILIVDEVLAVGDFEFQRKCIGKMQDVAFGEGRTVLFVSHNMGAVQSLCSRAIYLRDGRMVTDGSVAEAISEYIHSAGRRAGESVLAEREDREGGELLRLTDVEFLDAQTQTVRPILLSGDDVIVRVHHACAAESPLAGISFSVNFHTMAGSPLFGCSSKAVGPLTKVGPGNGCFDFRVRKWPLGGGRYFFSAEALQHGRPLDRVGDAGEVVVQAGDYYGTGKIPRGSSKGVLVEYECGARAPASSL